MRQLKRMISATFVAGISIALFGLSLASAQQDQVVLHGIKPLPNERYVMVTFLSGIEFWVPARKGMEHAAKQLGVQASYQGTEKYDAIDEARVLDQVIASQPTGILVTAQNPEALRPTIDKAVDAGIFCRDVRFRFAKEQKTCVPGRRQLPNRTEGRGTNGSSAK